MSEQMDLEVQIAEAQGSTSEVVAQLGAPSAFACPECHGTLWEIRDADLLRFRCQVGHAYSAETLLSAQTDGVEAALWAALRALEEKGDLNRRLANSATLRDDQLTARQFNEQYQAAEHHSAILRKMLADAQPSNARPNTGANASAEGEA